MKELTLKDICNTLCNLTTYQLCILVDRIKIELNERDIQKILEKERSNKNAKD